MPSTRDWLYASVARLFGQNGCSISGCEFNHPMGCASANVLCCALNLSDAIVRAGYDLPKASDVNYCSHGGSAPKRVRNADGCARVVRAQNGGSVDVSGWKNRPTWKGIVYFEGGLSLNEIYEQLTANTGKKSSIPVDFDTVFTATGHIDLWNGTKAVHAEYPDATTIWFWRLG